MKVKSLSHVRLLATPWTAAYQAPPSVGFSRQEYWSGVPLPSPNALLAYKKTKMLEGGSCHRIKLLNLYFSLPNELLKMSHEAPFHNRLKHAMSTGKVIL